MTVHHNLYLDHRRPEWRDAELKGRVHYDRVTRLVHIEDATIIAADLKRAT